jgi:hypothetical protein
MGGSDSKSQYPQGHIVMQLDKNFNLSGEDATGNIFIELTQPYPAMALDVTIKGKEKVKWEVNKTKHSSHSQQTVTYTEHHSAEHGVMMYGMNIHTFPG